MISVLLGFVVGAFAFVFLRPETEDELDLSKLLESVTPEQMTELSRVLSSEQLQLLLGLFSRNGNFDPESDQEEVN